MMRALLCSNLCNSFPSIALLLSIAMIFLLQSLIIGKRVQIVVHGMGSHVITPLLMSLASTSVVNCLYGTIHPNSSLFNLVHLQHLDLSLNNFNHSQILPSFGRFTNLTHLNLSGSHLSGPIQSSSKEVWQGNNFSNSIFHLQKLQDLWLRGNREENSQGVTNSIGQFEYLEPLSLVDCNFFGTIPTSLANLTRLISLDLSYNNFEGPIPQLFSNFSQLKAIYFSNNQLTGPIPSSLFHLNLTYLDLSSNNLSNTVELDTYAKLEYLDSLDLSNSSLSLTTTNSTPSSFRNITTLQLSSCNINEDLNPLCNLHYLIYLNLSNNQFGGLIPTCLGNFSGYLMVLNLQSNNFSGTIPQTFGYASRLQDLDISNNGLQGVLPRSLANCTKLEILNLGHNFIEDAFPFWLENLPQLKVIVLRDNEFHGPIEQPRKRLAFTNLHIIDMSHNEFTGTLPSKFFESMPSMMVDDEDKSSLNYRNFESES
ncbi:receptor-like protein 43 [Camellia sinensis]|uniref:receptor-like protein 43 n=1 Tax=Camellia sinensis TaxID=4442 RepID=UPI0010355C6A|nr:receptor-like protein 43 [Camellia sinensis]